MLNVVQTTIFHTIQVTFSQIYLPFSSLSGIVHRFTWICGSIFIISNGAWHNGQNCSPFTLARCESLCWFLPTVVTILSRALLAHWLSTLVLWHAGTLFFFILAYDLDNRLIFVCDNETSLLLDFDGMPVMVNEIKSSSPSSIVITWNKKRGYNRILD